MDDHLRRQGNKRKKLWISLQNNVSDFRVSMHITLIAQIVSYDLLFFTKAKTLCICDDYQAVMLFEKSKKYVKTNSEVGALTFPSPQCCFGSSLCWFPDLEDLLWC